MLADNKTLEDIGKVYGVSRQRMYQVLCKFGIETPVRKRRNFLRDKEPKYYWLSNILLRKNIRGEDRDNLLQTLVLPDTCPILNIKLNYTGTGEMGYSRADDSPSIDQIQAGGGYKKGNIAVISWRANRIKNDGTAEEHEKISDWMKKELQ